MKEFALILGTLLGLAVLGFVGMCAYILLFYIDDDGTGKK